uniref:FHF complex subunit HOOK-interacting protein C-terminal domain-containing protein n=3 Tax=Trichobilharzia regenti TaxID=157069 RepID=A0AA85IR39_TRIRE|nr:unnamed protein product [Trichobilharzia regenti]
MHLTEEDENNIQTINEFKVTWFTLLSRVDAAPTVDEIVLTSLNHVANLIMCRKGGSPSKSLVFEMALSLCVFETLFQWNFVFTGADLEAYKVRELQFYDSLIGNNGELYLSHEGFVIPFMATMHHCSIRSCLLVERALVRLLNTVCAILSAQFKSETVQNAVIHNNSGGNNNKDSNSIPAPARCADGLLLFRRMCMGVVDLSRIATDLNTNNNSSTKNLLNINLERCNSNPGLLSLKPMESIDWAMCLESSKLDTNSEFTASFTYDYDESHSSYRNDNIGLPTIDSICDLLAPYLFRDGDLGWQARDSLLLIAAYSLRDEEFSHSIAKYSSICAVIATGLGMLYTALPHRLVNNNSPETWPILIRTLHTNQEASARFTEFLGALDFCRSLLEIAHPLIQSCLLHCIHTIFFVSVIGRALTQRAAEDVITATVYLEQYIIHTVGSSLLPILLRFLLMKLPSHILLDSSSQVKYSAFEGSNNDDNNNQYGSTECSLASRISVNDVTSSEFFGESTENNLHKGESDNNNDSQHPNSVSSITYMDLIIARIHQCNSLLGITTLSLMNTIIDLHCEDIMFVLVLKHLISVRDDLFSIGWTWPDASSFTNTSTKILDLSSTTYNQSSAGYYPASNDYVINRVTGKEKIINDTSQPHRHHRSVPNHSHSVSTICGSVCSEAVAQLDIDDIENNSSGATTRQEVPNSEGLEALNTKSPSIAMHLDNLPVGGQFLASHLLIPHAELTANSLIMNNYRNDLQLDDNDDVNNNGSASHLSDFSQQTTIKVSSNLSLSPSSSSSSPTNNNSNNSSPVLVNSPNPMLDWLSYTSWAHQTIKIRKHACKTWQLTFDAVQPTIEQINILNENLKNIQMIEKEFSTCYQKTRKFSECDCRLGLDPYKTYTEYKCFINRNCCTNLEVKMKENELHAKALCTAAKKLNIETDLVLDGSENLDECQTTITEDNDELSSREKHLLDKGIHMNSSNNLLKNPMTTSSSVDRHLCSILRNSKLPPLYSNECLNHDNYHHMKSDDKTSIKSWYCLSFLDSADICDQLMANKSENIYPVQNDTTNLEKSNLNISHEFNEYSRTNQSEGNQDKPQDNSFIQQNESDFNEVNSTDDSYENHSYELNKFIEELETMPPESLPMDFNNSQELSTGHAISRTIENVIIPKYGSLSCLNSYTNEAYQYFDTLLKRLKSRSLHELTMEFNNNNNNSNDFQGKLYDVPLITTSFSRKTSTPKLENNESFNDEHLIYHSNTNVNATHETFGGLSKNKLIDSNNQCRHHHRLDYREIGFTHGSLSNLIQTRSNDSSSDENNDCNSPCSLKAMTIDEKINDLNRINNENYSFNCVKHSTLLSSPFKVAILSSKKRLSTSTVSSTTSSAYLETIQHLSQNTYKESLVYNANLLNVNNSVNDTCYLSTTTSTQEKGIDSHTTDPNLGPFLTTLLNRLENFTNNCFYANLYLTNLVSSLASYPIPLLRAMIFLSNTSELSQYIMNNSECNTKFRALHNDILCYLPYNILRSIKQQIDVFAALYTRQVKHFGLLETLNGYTFNELKQEARRYLNYEIIDPSKLLPVNMSSVSEFGSIKKKEKDSNTSHKESKYLPTGKPDISPMMNSNNRPYFRKWFGLSSKANSKNTNSNSTANNPTTNRSGITVHRNNRKTNKSRKSSSSNILNPKDLLDFSKILQKPMTEFTFPTNFGVTQQLNNYVSAHGDKNNTGSISGGHIQRQRRSFRLSTKKTSLDSHKNKGGAWIDEENLLLDVSRIQRMVLCAVIFEDFCKELAAICTEHSIQW